MTIRARVAGDDGFIFDSWLRSFRASHESGPYAPDLFFPACRETVTRILSRPTVETLVAEVQVKLDGDLVDVIAGYVVHEPRWRRWSKRRRRLEEFHIVHYLFVREDARDGGIGRALLEAAGVKRDIAATAFSFATPAARGALGGAVRFIPDAARYESRKETP